MSTLVSQVPAAPPADACLTDALLTFVRGIGLIVREDPIAGSTFLPGLLLENGQLVVDRSRLLHPGDILHEAGHLAVVPAAERPYLGGDIAALHPERAGDEMAVLPWTYAACRALHLPPAVVFHSAGYRGGSAWLIEQFEQGYAIGLPLLAWMGLTTMAEFPRMRQWLRD